MTAEAGHAPNRIYTAQDGSFHLNGAAFYNDAELDISASLEQLNSLAPAEIAFLDGSVAGTPTASKTDVQDANLELNGIGVIRKADVLIPTGEVLTLNGTPKQIVAAPGAGVYLEFLGAYVFLDYNAAAYAADAGEDLVFRYTDGSGDILSIPIDGEEFEVTADRLYIATPISTNPNVITHVDNLAIVAHLQVGEWATGNSPLKVRCFYRHVRKTALEAIA